MKPVSADLEHTITSLGKTTVMIAAIILAITTLVAIILNKRLSKRRFRPFKLPLFGIMATAMAGATLILLASTIYLNTQAESGGPVHWHADIEFWACGSELELRDPQGVLSNKIGTATYHEHNDKRIHLEGVVIKKATDASLRKFMQVTGGYMTNQAMALPLNANQDEWLATPEHQDGDPQSTAFLANIANYVGNEHDGPVLRLSNSRMCNEEPAELQTFVYHYNDDKTYYQTKLAQPAQYVMRAEEQVPAGDCIIVEFDTPKDRTNKLCEQYGVRDSQRCTEFGVKKYDPARCSLRQISPPAQQGTN